MFNIVNFDAKAYFANLNKRPSVCTGITEAGFATMGIVTKRNSDIDFSVLSLPTL